MKYLQAVVILLLALALTGFIQQNGSPTTLTYGKWVAPELPLSLYIIAAFAAGYLMAVFFGLGGILRSRLRLTSAERQIKALTQELESRKASREAPVDKGAAPATRFLERGTAAGTPYGPGTPGGDPPENLRGSGGTGGITEP